MKTLKLINIILNNDAVKRYMKDGPPWSSS